MTLFIIDYVRNRLREKFINAASATNYETNLSRFFWNLAFENVLVIVTKLMMYHNMAMHF